MGNVVDWFFRDSKFHLEGIQIPVVVTDPHLVKKGCMKISPEKAGSRVAVFSGGNLSEKPAKQGMFIIGMLSVSVASKDGGQLKSGSCCTDVVMGRSKIDGAVHVRKQIFSSVINQEEFKKHCEELSTKKKETLMLRNLGLTASWSVVHGLKQQSKDKVQKMDTKIVKHKKDVGTPKKQELLIAIPPPGGVCTMTNKYYAELPSSVKEIRSFIRSTLKEHGKGIKVAVLDNGICTHPDIRVVERWDFTNSLTGEKIDDTNQDKYFQSMSALLGFNASGGAVYDIHSHGTHCAGIIGGGGKSGGKMQGIANECMLYDIRVLDGYKKNSFEKLFPAAIDKCIELGIDVINLSLGGPIPHKVMEDACKKAVANGIVIFAAAGNDRRLTDVHTPPVVPDNATSIFPVCYTQAFPACYDCVISIGAVGLDITSKHESKLKAIDAGFSMFDCEFCMPGDEIVSCVNSLGQGQVTDVKYVPDANEESGFKQVLTVVIKPQYGQMSGTSMATPYACGLAACILKAESIPRNKDRTKKIRQIFSTKYVQPIDADKKIVGEGMLRYKPTKKKMDFVVKQFC